MQAQRTAMGAGMMRALEGRARRPLFVDPLAERLLAGWPAAVVRSRALRAIFLLLLERSGPGFYGAVVCRTRAIDDLCRRALDDGATQVVLLGAGMDTRAYRMPQMRAARVWELDLPAVQRVKRAALARALDEAPGHVRHLPVDLAEQGAGEALAGAGFDADARTVVVCEAVSLYVPDAAVARVLAYAGGLAPGSRLIMTYLTRAALRGARGGWARRLRWQTAYEPGELADRLPAHGLRLVADLGAEDHRERLLRPVGRELPVYDGERILVAERA